MNTNLDSLSNIYLDEDKRMTLYLNERIFELSKNIKSVLELGLGDGNSAEIFSRKINDYIVVEGSEELISKFKSKNIDCNINIINSYFEDFETDKKFDVIVLGFILEHVD